MNNKKSRIKIVSRLENYLRKEHNKNKEIKQKEMTDEEKIRYLEERRQLLMGDPTKTDVNYIVKEKTNTNRN